MYNTYKEPRSRRRSVGVSDRAMSAGVARNGSAGPTSHHHSSEDAGRADGNHGEMAASGMCDAEKKVLRRRKVTIAENVEIDADFLTSVRERNLIDEFAIPAILSEKGVTTRVGRLLEHISGSQLADPFGEFCEVLMMKGHAWLGKELDIERKIEMGDVHIDDDVNREAAMVVHRKFGTSKRFAEIDKKDITDLIAIQVQLSKEEWKREMEAIRKDLAIQTESHKTKDSKARQMEQTLIAFIKTHREQLTNHAHDMKSTTDAIQESAPYHDLLSKMRDKIDYILLRTKPALDQRSMMQDERHKCLDALGLKDDSISLYSVLMESMGKQPGKMAKLEKELQDKDHGTKRLREMVAELEGDLEVSENALKPLKEELRNKSELLERKDERIVELEKELEATMKVLESHRDKKYYAAPGRKS